MVAIATRTRQRRTLAQLQDELEAQRRAQLKVAKHVRGDNHSAERDSLDLAENKQRLGIAGEEAGRGREGTALTQGQGKGWRCMAVVATAVALAAVPVVHFLLANGE